MFPYKAFERVRSTLYYISHIPVSPALDNVF